MESNIQISTSADAPRLSWQGCSGTRSSSAGCNNIRGSFRAASSGTARCDQVSHGQRPARRHRSAAVSRCTCGRDRRPESAYRAESSRTCHGGSSRTPRTFPARFGHSVRGRRSGRGYAHPRRHPRSQADAQRAIRPGSDGAWGVDSPARTGENGRANQEPGKPRACWKNQYFVCWDIQTTSGTMAGRTRRKAGLDAAGSRARMA